MPKHGAFSLSFKAFGNLYDHLLGWVRLYSFRLPKVEENTIFEEKIRESISGKRMAC